MDREIRTKWVAALRSGKFLQAQGTLRTPTNRFCCLGVLCEIVQPDRWEQEASGVWRHDDFQSMPSEDALHAAGMVTDEQDATEKLANMNDQDNKTFAEIADYIEKML